MSYIPVFEDIEGVAQLAQNPMTNSNSTRVDVRHHFLNELVNREEISVIYVSSPFQHADCVNKAMSQESLELL